MGILVGLTAGLYVALNLLGAGGGKPSSAHMVQVVNSLLCAVWFFSASFGGSILNTIGPAITACFGVIGYIICESKNCSKALVANSFVRCGESLVF